MKPKPRVHYYRAGTKTGHLCGANVISIACCSATKSRATCKICIAKMARLKK